MCRKCLLKMQDPKSVVNPENMDLVHTMVKIMQEDALQIVNTILHFTEERIGKPISPAAIALAWGWFYYVSVYNQIHKGDFTLEEFERFDAALEKDTSEGVLEAYKSTGSGEVIFLADGNEPEKAIEDLLKSLGLRVANKPPEGGNLH